MVETLLQDIYSFCLKKNDFFLCLLATNLLQAHYCHVTLLRIIQPLSCACLCSVHQLDTNCFVLVCASVKDTQLQATTAQWNQCYKSSLIEKQKQTFVQKGRDKRGLWCSLVFASLTIRLFPSTLQIIFLTLFMPGCSNACVPVLTFQSLFKYLKTFIHQHIYYIVQKSSHHSGKVPYLF